MITEDKYPLISFIITCYNTPVDMLKECIDSIISLSIEKREREIIIVDDGSETNPLNELGDYNNEILFIHKANGGASTARNIGLEIAKGKYVQLIDGDDHLILFPYEHCLNIIKSQDVDLLLFDFSKKETSNSKYTDTKTTSGTEYLLKNNIQGAIWSMIFKRSIRGDLQFTPGIVCVEDEEFKPQLILRAKKVVHTNAQAYFYRQNPNSITHIYSPDSIAHRLHDNEKILVHLNEITKSLPQEKQRALKRRVAQLTMDYIYNIIILTHSKEKLYKSTDRLKSYGLYPLPKTKYSRKYIWFQRLSANRIGLITLVHILPLLTRER